MKISEGYILRTVAGKNIVVSVGAEASFSGMLTLNDTGVFFWNLLSEDITKEEMIDAVLREYDAERDIVTEDVEEFLAKLKDKGILED